MRQALAEEEGGVVDGAESQLPPLRIKARSRRPAPPRTENTSSEQHPS